MAQRRQQAKRDQLVNPDDGTATMAEALDDAKEGRVVDLDTALTEAPPAPEPDPPSRANYGPQEWPRQCPHCRCAASHTSPGSKPYRSGTNPHIKHRKRTCDKCGGVFQTQDMLSKSEYLSDWTPKAAGNPV